jgi:hypothetical protein
VIGSSIYASGSTIHLDTAHADFYLFENSFRNNYIYLNPTSSGASTVHLNFYSDGKIDGLLFYFILLVLLLLFILCYVICFYFFIYFIFQFIIVIL